MVYNGKLIKNSEGISPQNTIMFCFPYAGGGAASMLSGFKILTRNFRFAPYNYREEKNVLVRSHI